MFELKTIATQDKAVFYAELVQQAEGLLHGEQDMIANCANIAALLYHNLPDVNWAGFYLLQGDELVVGPFQGLPACVRIPLGRGVCGTAAATRETQVVADVNRFAGHIACDVASQSEIVVPLVKNDVVLGVLDIDSPHTGRFDDVDRAGLEHLVKIFIEALIVPRSP